MAFVNESGRPPAELAGLPTELLYMVTDFLEPIDIVRCRLVSPLYHQIFTSTHLFK